jgi:excisionase family DNA binding protein
MNTAEDTQVAPAGLRLPGASKYLGVSEGTVKKLVRAGKIRSVKLNRTRVFPRTALDELLAQRAA